MEIDSIEDSYTEETKGGNVSIRLTNLSLTPNLPETVNVFWPIFGFAKFMCKLLT